MQKYIFIALGGSLGSIARYWIGSTISGRYGTRFYYGTFVIWCGVLIAGAIS